MTNDCWFDPNVVATALKKCRLSGTLLTVCLRR